MAKPKVFIGSSRERLGIAEALHRALELDAEVTPWHLGAFRPSEYPLESLSAQLESADFAVFVFAPDDVLNMRGAENPSVRDNVIFELGLFIGRLGRQYTFIVRPRGLEMHLPSDLNGFGPVEYDPNRTDDNLVAAVGPAANEIRTAIRKKYKPGPILESAHAQAVTPIASDEANANISSIAPRPDWDLDAFRYGFLHASVVEDKEAAESINAAFSQSPHAQDEKLRIEWDAWRCYAEIEFGNSFGQVGRLREIAEKQPNNASIAYWWSQVRLSIGDKEGAYRTAADAFLKAESASSAKLLLNTLRESGEELSGLPLIQWRDQVLTLRGDTPAKFSEFGSAMKTIAEIAAFKKLGTAINEAVLSETPEDISLRFNVAYSYSQDDIPNHELSLFHYINIPAGIRDWVTWNNIGVSYDRLKMPGLSVTAYEHALQGSDGLADSNLALKLIGEGFIEQGRQRVKEAISAGKQHPSLADTLAQIESQTKNESSIKESALQSAAKRRRVMAKLGQAALERAAYDLEGTWLTEDGELRVWKEVPGTYMGRCETTEEGTPRLFGFATAPQKIVLELSCRTFGHAFEGSLRRGNANLVPSLLGGMLTERFITGYFEDNGNVMKVQRWDYGWQETTWTRLLAIEDTSSATASKSPATAPSPPRAPPSARSSASNGSS